MNKYKIINFYLIFFFLILTSSISIGQKQVKIGKQIWMKENLNVDRFQNGDAIPEAITHEEWMSAGKEGRPAWCYYANDPINGKTYGKLYNWYAVNDPRGLAPKGWHVPEFREWSMLADFLGGEKKAGTQLKSKQGWKMNGNGNDKSGFNALPGGSRYGDAVFDVLGFYGFWWTSSHAIDFNDLAASVALNMTDGNVVLENLNKYRGLSVRCVKD
ncbi:MAG: hypothetical protein FGM46_09565 [Ferruginibacter sp.]|nr:hypothetical protein [Ferruginibacter sp.]